MKTRIDEFTEARLKKDKYYDGKFFFGVKTTGIFCRPSCPSPIAKEENVVYFNSIFEALEYGLRPCYRCRPDVEVEYYNGNADGIFVVNIALKMIYDGYLNYNSIKDMASELLISDRHLRTLFIESLGVPPVTIARYHKALFAKRLLLASDQPITDIAFASGFGSIRQFNEVFKKTFGKSPSEMRRESLKESARNVNTTLLLKYNKPFDFSQVLSFMQKRAIKGVEVICDNAYSRTFRTENTKGYFTVTDNPAASFLELKIYCDDIRCYMEIYNRVRRMFDLDTDFSEINIRLSKDKRLSRGMVNGHVPRLPVAFDPFEFVVRAILGQQISVAAATTLASRIAEKASLKSPENFPVGLNFFFPDPTELQQTDLTDIGITTVRQITIRTATQAVIEKTISLSSNQRFETFNKAFSSLKGIGDWTVNYVAMRGLGIIDSFPATDLGVIRALTTGEKPPSEKEILKIAENWSPYRTYAALCLWQSGD